jgi:transcriptional regulator of acetoin/glycerol metabolism
MSIGHGSQVLVSSAAAELARENLPADTWLIDLGDHRLKDLVRSERVYQLAHEALPTNFPPLNSLDAFPNNLPVQITSFIGREREIEQAKKLLAEHRLVTLTGSGGTGKTRLAQQVAAELAPTFKDGVWLVELAAVTDPELVTQELAGVLGLQSIEGTGLLRIIADYLRGKQTLIILDNCEHLRRLRRWSAFVSISQSEKLLEPAGSFELPVR